MSTFSPRPGAAPLPRMVATQAVMETQLILRNGEQVLLAVVIPTLVLVGGILGSAKVGIDFSRSAVDVLTPGVLALAVMSTAFTSLAIATGFERRYGVIKRLGSSPLPRTGLLVGKIGALLLVELLQLLVIGLVAFGFGWSPALGGIPAAILAAIAGTAAFAGLGLFVAGVLRAEATLAAANLIYFLLMVAGAVVLPTSSYGWFGHVAQWLPSGALGDSMRAALVAGNLDLPGLGVLIGWALLGAALTARTFKWE